MNLIYGVIGTYALSNCSGSSLAKKQFFRKPTRPSLPLRKAPPLISVFFNGLYTPFGSPVSGGQKPQGRRGKPPLVLLFLKSPRPSLPLKRAPPLTPTLSPSGKREETAPPRRSEPLRSKVGGPSKVFARCCAGWDRLITTCFWSSPCCAGWDRLGIAVYSLQLIVYSLRLISWLFDDNLQISC